MHTWSFCSGSDIELSLVYHCIALHLEAFGSNIEAKNARSLCIVTFSRSFFCQELDDSVILSLLSLIRADEPQGTDEDSWNTGDLRALVSAK